MTGRDALVRTKELLSEEDKWHKGDFFELDDQGQPIRYCLLGALHLATDTVHNSLYGDVVVLGYDGIASHENRGAFQAARTLIGGCLSQAWCGDVANFNDCAETTHADVLAVLDCAISKTLE